jgi:hypothetical protein
MAIALRNMICALVSIKMVRLLILRLGQSRNTFFAPSQLQRRKLTPIPATRVGFSDFINPAGWIDFGNRSLKQRTKFPSV